MSELEDLREELKRYREAYYNLAPVVSDQVYDAKLERLRELAPEDEEVKAVGAAPPKMSVWEKVEHKIPMGSLSKVNSPEEFKAWAAKRLKDAPTLMNPDVEKYFKRFPFLMTMKVDGSSMELVYQEGKLVRCVTRGDGKVGEDVTKNISRVPSVPKEIFLSKSANLLMEGEVTVRGEIVMFKEVFEREYAKEYANPRNTAAGKVRDTRATDEDCANLTFLAYSVQVEPNKELAPYGEEHRFRFLESLGFKVPQFHGGDAEEVASFYEMKSSKIGRDMVPYEIDGIVVRLNNIYLQEYYGEHNMRPIGQVAYKFDPAMGVTRVTDVKWQVGPTGRITPVAVVDPVSIGGVTITSISLHNLSMFAELALRPGDEVLVERANDVIPYLRENLSRRET